MRAKIYKRLYGNRKTTIIFIIESASNTYKCLKNFDTVEDRLSQNRKVVCHYTNFAIMSVYETM